MIRLRDRIGFKFQWGLSVQRADDAIQTMLKRTPRFYGFMIFHMWIGVVYSQRGRDVCGEFLVDDGSEDE